MDAVYDPNASGAPFEYGGDKINIGLTDSNGVIHIGDDAFTNFYQDSRGRYFPSYDYLESVYQKELFTQNRVFNNITFEKQDVSMINIEYRNEIMC